MQFEGQLHAEGRFCASLLVAPERSDEPNLRRITVAGELDRLSAAAFHDAVIGLLRRQRPHRIEINVRGVIRLDATGTGVLLVCHADAARLGCRLSLIDPHPQVFEVLRDAALTGHFGLKAAPANRARVRSRVLR
jgi:anti-anti-sigma factor